MTFFQIKRLTFPPALYIDIASRLYTYIFPSKKKKSTHSSGPFTPHLMLLNHRRYVQQSGPTLKSQTDEEKNADYLITISVKAGGEWSVDDVEE